ncbi:hypothetical protein C8R45DRAFT_996954 [Mycena sanguinolenta]|nr:hypothetical protein C8R45DRAFT_996954 [Mycena sanguinolenta]
MPTLAHDYPFKPSAFLRLPQELLDEIISDLEHKDLVSLALVSRASSALVVPRHTEYRVLRIRHLLPAMWAHLARRSDLARNIREVHICERLNKSASDRVPKSLIDQVVDEKITHVVEERRIRNICTALGHMHRLHTFTWSWEVDPPSPPTIDSEHENAILEVLSRSKTLRHLGLSGMFGIHAPGMANDLESTLYPLWRFSNLTSISLRGNAWIKPMNTIHLKRMLRRSAANLEYLEIPMEFSALVDCKFPYLKRLNLFLQAGGIRSIDPRVVRFLDDHPSIEDLSWLPLGPVYISPQSLPALKRVRTNIQVVGMLDSPVESLDIYQLDPTTLVQLKNLQCGSVRQVKLHAFGDLNSMYELAELFPDLTWLSMPSRYGHFSLEDWLDLLPRFPKLEVFRGQALWAAVTLNMQRMHGVIMQLVQLCPNLRQLDHSGHNQARQDWNRITIVREGPEGENVRYQVRRSFRL